MKIAVIADSHDHCDRIEWFLDRFKEAGVEMLLHLGDIVAPFAAKRFARLARRIPFVAIYGNNDGERAGLRSVISAWGSVGDGPLRLEAGGKTLVLRHCPLSAAEVLALYPDADYFLSGHTHERADARAGRLRLINPGEAGGWLTGVATAGILDPGEDVFREIRCP